MAANGALFEMPITSKPSGSLVTRSPWHALMLGSAEPPHAHFLHRLGDGRDGLRQVFLRHLAHATDTKRIGEGKPAGEDDEAALLHALEQLVEAEGRLARIVEGRDNGRGKLVGDDCDETELAHPVHQPAPVAAVALEPGRRAALPLMLAAGLREGGEHLRRRREAENAGAVHMLVLIPEVERSE